MDFESDAFISYAHLDNIGLVEGQRGWVANLQRALEVRLSQLRGRHAQIWWDPKLQGNDILADTIVERLEHVATLVSVISPRYVQSDWSRKELLAFLQSASLQGGIRVSDKTRIFKVLKTPVPPEMHPPELRSLIGYEFFKVDPESGKVRELNEIFGPEAQREFWIKLDDLAHDMCGLLQLLEGKPPDPELQPTESGAIFLAETTADLRDQREAIKRDLQQHGYAVLPSRPLPVTAAEVTAAVTADLALCRMSIHLVGRHYSLVPEGGVQSLLEIQHQLAITRGEQGEFSHLVWMLPGLQADDPRQRKVLEQLRTEPRMQGHADVLETPLEELWTVIDGWLKRQAKPSPAPAPADTSPTNTAPRPQLYLIHDQRDADAARSAGDFLFQQQFEVISPLFEGDETELREYHEENLRNADGVLIFSGATNEAWLRRKLRELHKIPGFGRTKPMPVVAVCFGPPKTAEKERFRTHEALVIPQWDGFSPDALEPFVSRLQGTRKDR